MVFLPREIDGAVQEREVLEDRDIEVIDSYKDTKYRAAIFERERGQCFYCRRTLTEEDFGLDHVDQQVESGTNSYRNVVAACHSCNSLKCADTAEGFIRKLYRRGFLDAGEMEARLADLDRLKKGLLLPNIS